MKKLLSLILSLAVIFAGILPASMVSASAGTDATLKDICFENHSVFVEASEGVYQGVEQPYRFSKTGDNYPKPSVSATPTDPNATVDISSAANPDIKNGWIVTIKVTAADGVTKKTYNLYTKPVGQNMYSNPGFESSDLSMWTMSGADSTEITGSEKYAGNNSLKFDTNSTVSSPSQKINLISNNGVTWFSSVAAKSEMGLRAGNENGTSYISGGTHYYIDRNGDKIVDENEIPYTYSDTTTRSKLVTTADEDDWQLTMRISTGLSSLQESIQNTSGAGKVVYYDEFYLGALVISEIKVSGDTYAKLGEESTLNYSASLLNQYGNKGGVNGQTVTWKLINAPQGVSIDENTGVVTVADTVSETGDFYVEAQVLNPTYNTLAAGTTNDYLGYCQTQMGGRIKVSLLPANAEAALSDITVNGGGIDGFKSDVTEYDIYVPYSYSANNFTFARPVVSATPVMDGADVNITYPATIADDEKIYIDVKDTTGTLSTRYTLNVKTVGGNLFPDGGFESTSASDYSNQDAGYIQNITIVEGAAGAGNKVLKASGSRNSGSILGVLANKNSDGTYGVVLNKDKSYISGFMIKKDPETPTSNTNTNAIVRVNGLGTSVADGKRYYNNTGNTPTVGDAVGVNFAIPNAWTTYSSVLVSLDQNGTSGWQNINRRVGFAIGSPNTVSAPTSADYTTKAAYFLFDDMYIGELVIADMDLTDAEGENATTVRKGEAKEVKLGVELKNQYGNTNGITSNTISYAVLDNYQGVSVASDGTVTIAANAKAGTAVIEATVTPEWRGSAQPYVKQRYSVTIIPENGFVYSAGTISAGDIVTTLNYTAQEDAELMFITALYEVVDGELVFNYCEIDDTISLTDGQFVSKDLTLTVPSTGTYRIKSFLFEKGTLKPMLNTVGTLGQ